MPSIAGVKKNWLRCFSKLLKRIYLFRFFNSHRHLTDRLFAKPTVLGVINTFDIEFTPYAKGEIASKIVKRANLIIVG